MRPSAIIQRKVASGELPTDKPVEEWGGFGNGRPCNGCGLSILPQEPERELDMPDGRILRFHLACESAWRIAVAHAEAHIAERPAGE